MRRTLASPSFAISSNSPSTIFAEALSASIRTARRGERGSEGMRYSPNEMQFRKQFREPMKLSTCRHSVTSAGVKLDERDLGVLCVFEKFGVVAQLVDGAWCLEAG